MEKLSQPIFQVKAHDKIINCIDGAGGYGIQCGAPELVTGGADGRLDTEKVYGLIIGRMRPRMGY